MRPTALASRIALIAALAVGSFAATPSFADQGWSEEQRRQFYWAPQGSRLIPLSWFEALERADSDELFATMPHLTSFGFLPPPQELPNRLPIGFAIDTRDARDLTYSDLVWYNDQPQSDNNAEAWVGPTCAACHTGSFTHQGEMTYIDGGAANLDFQSFIEALDLALNATVDDDAKFLRFAAAVLGRRNDENNQELLRAALSKLTDWQNRAAAMNFGDLEPSERMRYGHGRLDAFGHIFNKVLMFADESTTIGNPSNAPVSYPFLWNIWKQGVVQWNGIAPNSPMPLLNGVDTGALGRNAGQVIGVFGDVDFEPVSQSITGQT